MSINARDLAYGIADGLVEINDVVAEDDKLENACRNLAENDTEENRKAVHDAYEEWNKELVDVSPLNNKLVEDAANERMKKAVEDYGNAPALEKFLDILDDEREKRGERRQNQLERNKCSKFLGIFEQAEIHIPRDPLVLDLDGDGIELYTESPVLFDLDGNGIKEGNAWIDSDDGILVLDRNGNGAIDDGRELFGDQTLLGDGNLADDGFEALRELDTNSDGFIDVNDQQFSELKIWRDINSDGISQAEELFDLSAYDVESIDLSGDDGSIDYGEGNSAIKTSTYSDSSSNTHLIGSMVLNSSVFHTEFIESDPLPLHLADLPSVAGMGRLRSLAYASSDSQDLESLYISYVNSGTEQRLGLIENLVLEWGKTNHFVYESNYSFSGVQQYIDNDPINGETEEYSLLVNKVKTLEAFSGRRFSDETLVPGQVDLIEQSFSELTSEIGSILNEKILFTKYSDLIDSDYSSGSLEFLFTDLISEIDLIFSQDFTSGIAELSALFDIGFEKYVNIGFDLLQIFDDKLNGYALTPEQINLMSEFGLSYENGILTDTNRNSR